MKKVAVTRHLARGPAGAGVEAEDVVAVEQPLEIRVRYERAGQVVQRTLAVTMRTPGHDADLARGFLWTEGIVRDPGAIHAVGQPEPDRVVVALAPGITPALQSAERNFYTTSSCGVCGKATIEAVRIAAGWPPPAPDAPRLTPAVVASLPERLRAAQPTFAATGGLHAAGLCGADGTLRVAREDVGRHNAVDKVVGATLAAGGLPARDAVLVVSGRASFELVQKCVLAGVPALAAVGAPSSLAVALARELGLTLLGFVRDGRFNCYAGGERLRDA